MRDRSGTPQAASHSLSLHQILDAKGHSEH
jgi:hypothetical protein